MDLVFVLLKINLRFSIILNTEFEIVKSRFGNILLKYKILIL